MLRGSIHNGAVLICSEFLHTYAAAWVVRSFEPFEMKHGYSSSKIECFSASNVDPVVVAATTQSSRKVHIGILTGKQSLTIATHGSCSVMISVVFLRQDSRVLLSFTAELWF